MLRSNRHLAAAVALAIFLVLAVVPSTSAADTFLCYVGTYTKGTDSKGIYAYEFNPADGSLAPLGVTEGVENPSFLAIHPSGKFLYSVDEVNDYQGKSSGAVSAFAVEPATGKLTKLNTMASQGADPCHLCVSHDGRHLLAASYTGGSVIAFPLAVDGKLEASTSFIQHTGSSVNAERQTSPHAHWVALIDPTDSYAFVADLGTDQIVQYKFDAAASKLTPNDPPSANVKPGAGPRHVAFHPSGVHAYVINELDLTITQLAYDAARGVFTPGASISVMPEGAATTGVSTAEIAVHPSGKFLYGSIRGLDAVVVFAIDQASGGLKLVEHEPTQGHTPRHFAIDPTGQWLLAENQGSNSIVEFKINQDTGELEPAGHKIDVPAPVCIVVLKR